MNYLFVSDFSCLIATCKSIKLGLLKKKKQELIYLNIKKKNNTVFMYGVSLNENIA